MNKKNFYVDIHVLQTTYHPVVSTAMIREVQNSRIRRGYQSKGFPVNQWKHAMRAMFSDILRKRRWNTYKTCGRYDCFQNSAT